MKYEDFIKVISLLNWARLEFSVCNENGGSIYTVYKLDELIKTIAEVVNFNRINEYTFYPLEISCYEK